MIRSACRAHIGSLQRVSLSSFTFQFVHDNRVELGEDVKNDEREKKWIVEGGMLEKERRDEQKTRKRIEEHWHTRTRGKRRAGKSERVQLPTGNGKQTKRGKRGKGRGARTSEKQSQESYDKMQATRNEGQNPCASKDAAVGAAVAAREGQEEQEK
ncbi:hypothetical protein ALC53_08359 [Atta colombica]|uniref:Uncharacterized protein n=1 Tax=Atta colombica TaxID=520822 RepID=A0A195B9T1_9HYME|nr:hypothetical protein ALC53_08359 [Atta colombica]